MHNISQLQTVHTLQSCLSLTCALVSIVNAGISTVLVLQHRYRVGSIRIRGGTARQQHWDIQLSISQYIIPLTNPLIQHMQPV
jgi:hypothetical protein